MELHVIAFLVEVMLLVVAVTATIMKIRSSTEKVSLVMGTVGETVDDLKDVVSDLTKAVHGLQINNANHEARIAQLERQTE